MLTRLDDALIDHDKVEEAGLKLGKNGYLVAFGACCWAFCYANKKLTDGVIPERALDKYSVPRPVVEVMVAVNLWEQVEGGYRVHDFHDWNPTAAAVKDKRKRDRERKRKIVGLAKEVDATPSGIPRGNSNGSQSDGIEESGASSSHAHAGALPNRDGRGSDSRSEENVPAAILASQTSHRRHAACGRICVPDFLHVQFIRQLGGDEVEASDRLRKWYRETETEWAGKPIGDSPEKFWPARFVEWVGTTTRANDAAQAEADRKHEALRRQTKERLAAVRRPV